MTSGDLGAILGRRNQLRSVRHSPLGALRNLAADDVADTFMSIRYDRQWTTDNAYEDLADTSTPSIASSSALNQRIDLIRYTRPRIRPTTIIP